jgi:hypothetical protein
MRWILLWSAFSLLTPTEAGAQDYKRSVKLSKGKVRVEFTVRQPEGRPSGPAHHPRVGVAPSLNPGLTAFLTKAFDEGSKVEAVPASELSANAVMATQIGSMLRSEVRNLVDAICRKGKLDYAFFLDQGTPALKAGFGASFGLGRMHWRSEQDARLFDCRTKQSVWHQSVLLDTSQSVFKMNNSGTTAGLTGSPEADKAMANVIAEKLTGDMAW